MSDILRPPGPVRLLCPWNSSGKSTAVDCHPLLQGIFPSQGSNLHLLCLLHCRRILYPLSHLGWHAYHLVFFRGAPKTQLVPFVSIKTHFFFQAMNACVTADPHNLCCLWLHSFQIGPRFSNAISPQTPSWDAEISSVPKLPVWGGLVLSMCSVAPL